MSPLDIYRLARAAGLSRREAITATAIALAESAGNPRAVGDTSLTDATWGPSIGLWQVRSLNAERGEGTARDATRLRDPRFNAGAMAGISAGGTNWEPWSAYTNGAYREHLEEAVAAAEAAAGRGPTTGGVAQEVDWHDALGGMVDKATDPFGFGDDLLGLGGDVAGGLAGGLGLEVDAFRPVVLTGVVVLGGLALIVAGAAAAVRPVKENIEQGLTGGMVGGGAAA